MGELSSFLEQPEESPSLIIQDRNPQESAAHLVAAKGTGPITYNPAQQPA